MSLGLNPEFHEKKLFELVSGFGLPKWINKRLPVCPSCGEPLSPGDARALGVNFSARYFGDFSVEMMCRKCDAGFSLHWRRACMTMADFVMVLEKDPGTDPVLQQEIAEAENNLSAIILEEMNE